VHPIHAEPVIVDFIFNHYEEGYCEVSPLYSTTDNFSIKYVDLHKALKALTGLDTFREGD
jgi:hypothetical protein